MIFEKAQVRLVLMILAASTAVLLAAYFMLFRTVYVPAYQNIRESDASEIVAALAEAGIPYRLENQGHDILVAEDKAAEARVLVAGANLPLSGTVGFELFNDSDMGLTEFAQKINLQRAQQGELARTIMSMEGIAFARVHLALPERSIYRSEQGKPTAAVTVQMRPGMPITPQRIDGIRQLVAHAVPGLEVQSVAVLDQVGELVSDQPPPANGFGAPLTERAALEQYYETRARAAIDEAVPDLRFEVTVNTRSTVVVSGAGELGHGAPRREDLTISVLVRTAEDLAIEKRDRVEAALSDALELDRANGDSLAFSVGLASAPATTVQRSARPGTVAPRMEDLAAPNPWGWLYSRWTLMALVLMGLAALVLRPRRQLDDQEAASFAELLRSSIAEREIADAK